MRVVILRRRVSIGHFIRGSVDMRDVVRITCIFVFFLLQIHCSCTLGLVTIFIYIHCTYLLYMWMYVFLSPTPYMCCFFSLLYTCFLYLYAIYYFCFTQRCLNEFCLKCFRNTSCQSLLTINSLLAKVFHEVMLG